MHRTILPAVLLALPAAAQQAGGPLPVATVARVIPAEIVDRIPVAGTLVPRDEVLAVPQVSGFPIQALLRDAVEAGDVMARLDDRTLAAHLAQAEAELARARADQGASALDRTRALRENGNTTQVILDQAVAADLTAQAGLRTARDGLLVAQAQVQQAVAARDIAALNLTNAVIRAPVGGLVPARPGQVGANAGSSASSRTAPSRSRPR